MSQPGSMQSCRRLAAVSTQTCSGELPGLLRGGEETIRVGLGRPSALGTCCRVVSNVDVLTTGVWVCLGGVQTNM